VLRKLLAGSGILFAISLVAPLEGQQTLAPRGDGFRFDSPLSLSAGRDEGFPANGGKLSDTVSILEIPGLALVKNSRRFNFGLDYQPEFEWFQEHRNLDAWNHTAMLHLESRITRQLSLTLGDSYISTQDPTRRLPDNLFLLPRGRYQQNSAYAGLGYRLDRQTSIGFRFDNSTIQATQPFRFDQVGNDWTMTVDRLVGRRHKFSPSYSYLRFHPLHRREQFSESSFFTAGEVHRAGVDYVFTVNPGLMVQLSGGAIRSHQTGYTAGVQVEKRFGEMWATASYQRYLAFLGGLGPTGSALPGTVRFANGLLPGFLYQVVSVGFRGQLTQRVGMNVKGLATRNSGAGPGRAAETMLGRARLDYKLTDRVIPFVSFDVYHQNVNSFLNFPLARKRYFGGLDILLFNPREAAVASSRRPANPDESDERQEDKARRKEER